MFSDALEAADRAVLFKTAVKEIGARFGIMPSFMAKWNQVIRVAAATFTRASPIQVAAEIFSMTPRGVNR